MAKVSLKDIDKKYDNGFEAVKKLSLEIHDKEFLVLVGPSGCGKSTTLRMIAGLEDISGGELSIGDMLVNYVEPKDRDIAMVFQNYALYPHMSVFDNMAFGLKLRKTPKSEINERVTAAAKTLEIEDLLSRKPKQLSGGQRQRVALGRAIVRDPKVFLMDEPLSNLDAKLRVQMRSEIIKLHKKLNTTFIYVTHDQTEAMTMGDRIVVMDKGLVQQVASPQEIYDAPSNVFVAKFIGSPQMNLIRGKVTPASGENIQIEFDGGCFIPCPKKQELLKSKGYSGKYVLVGIRPEHMRTCRGGENPMMSATVEVTEHLGSETYVYANSPSGNIVFRTKPDVSIQIGNESGIHFDVEKIHLFDTETECRIV